MNNKIPRNWHQITYKALIATTAGVPGDVFTVQRGEYGQGPITTNQRTGKRFQTFLCHLRDGNYAEIIEII